MQAWSLELPLGVLGLGSMFGEGQGHSYFLAQVAAQSLSTLSLQASLYSTWSGRHHELSALPHDSPHCHPQPLGLVSVGQEGSHGPGPRVDSLGGAPEPIHFLDAWKQTQLSS